IPERACKVLSNVVAPEPPRLIAVPVPEPSGAMPPTAPPKVVGPLPAFTVRLLLPSTVLAKLTAELLLETVDAAPTVSGLLNAIAPAAVLVTLPPSVMLLLFVAV